MGSDAGPGSKCSTRATLIPALLQQLCGGRDVEWGTPLRSGVNPESRGCGESPLVQPSLRPLGSVSLKALRDWSKVTQGRVSPHSTGVWREPQRDRHAVSALGAATQVCGLGGSVRGSGAGRRQRR